jgi:hypothetical protein
VADKSRVSRNHRKTRKQTAAGHAGDEITITSDSGLCLTAARLRCSTSPPDKVMSVTTPMRQSGWR